MTEGTPTRLAQLPRTKPLRIGLFSESFHPVQNGVTTSVRTLTEELERQGHHVWVFAPQHHDQPENETNVVRFPSFVTHLNPEYPLAYPFIPKLRLISYIEKLKLDVIHTHTPFVLGLTGADLAIHHGIPLISTFHTLYSEYSHYISFLPEAFTHGLLEAFLPWYYNRCTTILCPSHMAAKHLRNLGVDRPIEAVPTGIPLPPCEAVTKSACLAARARMGVEQDAPLLVYAGRLAPEKNIAWLLDVFVRVHERDPATRLALAGGGPLLEPLMQYARTCGLQEAVVFLGPTPRSEMDSLYAAADLFVFPSPSETQGLVIGEARAAGTPSVVIDAGGAPETVQEGIDGFRIREGDQDGFVDCVARVLHDRSLRATLSANALITAREQTPEKMVARILDIYYRACQSAQYESAPKAKWRFHRESEEDAEADPWDVANLQ